MTNPFEQLEQALAQAKAIAYAAKRENRRLTGQVKVLEQNLDLCRTDNSELRLELRTARRMLKDLRYANRRIANRPEAGETNKTSVEVIHVTQPKSKRGAYQK